MRHEVPVPLFQRAVKPPSAGTGHSNPKSGRKHNEPRDWPRVRQEFLAVAEFARIPVFAGARNSHELPAIRLPQRSVLGSGEVSKLAWMTSDSSRDRSLPSRRRAGGLSAS